MSELSTHFDDASRHRMIEQLWEAGGRARGQAPCGDDSTILSRLTAARPGPPGRARAPAALLQLARRSPERLSSRKFDHL